MHLLVNANQCKEKDMIFSYSVNIIIHVGHQFCIVQFLPKKIFQVLEIVRKLLAFEGIYYSDV